MPIEILVVLLIIFVIGNGLSVATLNDDGKKKKCIVVLLIAIIITATGVLWIIASDNRLDDIDLGDYEIYSVEHGNDTTEQYVYYKLEKFSVTKQFGQGFAHDKHMINIVKNDRYSLGMKWPRDDYKLTPVLKEDVYD
jgi:hypothetical protein